MMSAAAAEGQGIQALDSVLERLAGWLRSGGEADLIVPAVSQADDRGVDRLFRQLVPGRHRPALGARDHPPPAPKVGPGPLALANPGAGARPGPCAGRAARAGPRRAANGSTRSSPRLRRTPIVADLEELVGQLGQRGVEPAASSSTWASAVASAFTPR